jgi:hypothetical protein
MSLLSLTNLVGTLLIYDFVVVRLNVRVIVMPLLSYLITSWLILSKVIDLPLTTVGSNLDGDFEFFHVRKLSS